MVNFINLRVLCENRTRLAALEARHLNQSVKSTGFGGKGFQPVICMSADCKPMPRCFSERPVGVEPTLPPWQGSRLPLHHGRLLFRFVSEHREGLEPSSPDYKTGILAAVRPMQVGCRCVVVGLQLRPPHSGLRFQIVGPEGFEPSPIWLRARHAANNTSDPRYKCFCCKSSRAGGIRTPTKHFKRVLCYR